MAQRKETVRFQAVGNLDKELGKIASATEKASKAMDEMGKSTKESAEKITSSVDQTKKAVEGLAAKFLTFEVAKQVLEKTVAFLADATKKYKDAEIAAGGSLNEIAKKSANLSREVDNLTLSIGKFTTRVEESALSDGDGVASNLTNLIDKASDFTDELVTMGKTVLFVGSIPLTGGLSLLLTQLPSATKFLDEMTGATDSLLESTGKLTKEFKEAYDPLSSMYGLYEAGYKAYSKANHFQFNSMFGVSGTGEPADKKPKGKKRKTDSLDDLVNIKPKGEEARALADQLAADQAKRDAEQKEIEFLERKAGLLLRGLEYEAELLDIENEALGPMERRLRLQEADNEEAMRRADIQREINQKQEEANALDAAAVSTKGQEAQEYSAWAEQVAGSLGFAQEAAIAKAATDAAVYQYQALALGAIPGAQAQAATMQSAAIGAFIVAGTSAIGGILGLGGGAAPKKTKASSATSARTGQNAREAKESANTAASPSNTVYNVSINSVSKLSAKEARVVAEALNLNARSRV